MTINPFTLKELRQGTRAKAISGSLIAFLFISLLISYFVPVSGIGQDTGSVLFFAVYSVLCLVLCFVLPRNVYARLNGERGGAKTNADFTLLTALPPSEIVDGKLRGAFAMIALFVSATFPFCVFAYLLHGITFEGMGKALLILVCHSCVAVHIALAIAALRIGKVVRNIVFMLFLVANVLVNAGAFAFETEFASCMEIRPLAVIVALAVTVCCLVRAYTVAFLSPLVLVRDRAIKRTTLVAVLGWGGYALTFMADGVDKFADVYPPFLACAFLCVILLAAYASAQPFLPRYVSGSETARIKGPWPIFFFVVFLGLLVSAFEPCIKPWMDAQYMASGIVRCGGEPKVLENPFTMGILFMYSISLILVFRVLMRFISRSANISPILVPFLAFSVFMFLQSVPNLLAMDGLHDIDCYKALPFNMRGVGECRDLHLMYSAIAFAVGTLGLSLERGRRPRS